MIVFDLEWTQPFGQDSMEEIIQIGAVKIEELGGPVTDSFTVYIKPSVYQELSPIAKLAFPHDAESADFERVTVSPTLTVLNLRVSISLISVP